MRILGSDTPNVVVYARPDFEVRLPISIAMFVMTPACYKCNSPARFQNLPPLLSLALTQHSGNPQNWSNSTRRNNRDEATATIGAHVGSPLVCMLHLQAIESLTPFLAVNTPLLDSDLQFRLYVDDRGGSHHNLQTVTNQKCKLPVNQKCKLCCKFYTE